MSFSTHSNLRGGSLHKKKFNRDVQPLRVLRSVVISSNLTRRRRTEARGVQQSKNFRWMGRDLFIYLAWNSMHMTDYRKERLIEGLNWSGPTHT